MTEPIKLNLTLEELKLIDKYVELNDDTQQLFNKIKSAYPSQKSPVEEAYKDWWGQYPQLETDSEYDEMRWQGFQAGYEATQPKAVPVEEPYKNVRAYWDEKDNPKPMDEVVDRLIKKYQAQKLYNRLFEVGYDKEDCDIILSVVEDWLPDPQSAVGSQNVNTELLVDGFNDAIRKMKEMLR